MPVESPRAGLTYRPGRRRAIRPFLVAGLAGLLAAGAVAVVPSVSVADPATRAVGAPRSVQASGPEETKLVVRAEPDGSAVSLDASFWPQTDGLKHPLVLLAHGFGGSKDSVSTQAIALQERGYVVATWSARGHGRSGGRIHLNDPTYEIADAKALLDLAAERADVELDAAGDPRAGVLGASYGGALGLMLAGSDARVDAVVSAITWNDLADAFFPQAAVTTAATTPAGRTPIGTPGPFKQVWASNFFLGALGSALPGTVVPATGAGQGVGAGASAAPRASSCGRFDPTICRLFVQASETGTPSDELVTLLRAHSPRPTLSRVTAPTMLIQGLADSLFGLDQADASATALAAAKTPLAVRWSDGGHDGASTHEAEETEAGYAWLDHYVRDKAPRDSALPTPGFVYPTAAQRRSQPATLWSLPSYPGLVGTTVPTTRLALSSTRGGLVHPPGGQPAALVAVPALSSLGVGLSTYQIAALPGQSTALDTGPVEKAVTVVGSPTLTLTLTADTPTVTLFASLWRLNGNQPTLPNALVAPIRVPVTPGRPTTVTVSLPAATYAMPAGSRWRVLLTSTESTFSNDRTPSGILVEASGQLDLPTEDGTRIGAGAAGRPDTETVIAASILAALLVIAAVGALLRRHRRRLEPSRPDLAEVPLVVDGLVKTYADGHRAVDDVSWRAEKGQVVGLLGPNGAGKTTTMRMVMGLISSDSGTVHVLGDPVHAGAPVLGRVGALIEGPGFLPHLTGRANLEAYWAATGRAPEEARFDEALAVAALGGAVDRPVKSYSHGMKQRLGIAQAMLGMPDLLILDEPTNGLDPPQIAAMRPILRRYADTGRTVVISSHLLAEVEMTCTHVIVMHAGRVITQGAVADLVDSNDTTIVDLADGVDTARIVGGVAALEVHPGITDVRVETPTRLVVVADIGRAEVVEAAVEAGLPVVGVSSRRHLEEVFLGVISTASGGSTSGAGDDGAGSSMIERLRQVRAR